MVRQLASPLSLAAVLIGGASPVAAQTYPVRAIRIIVPTAPGGSIDATARIVGDKLQEKWGKPVAIENRAGAAMRIGAEAGREVAARRLHAAGRP